MTNGETSRATYHHGDLRRALVDAGARLAEKGGPEAVGVRAAARRVGVTPTAAYRHFAGAEDLRAAVQERAFGALSRAVAAEAKTAPTDARARLEAIGRGYVRFALAEPGLFRTAFGPGGGTLETAGGEASAFSLLVEALDALVTAGELPPERRPLAEIAAWSAVHGLARLVLDGPLAALPESARAAAIERTLTMISRGL